MAVAGQREILEVVVVSRPVGGAPNLYADRRRGGIATPDGQSVDPEPARPECVDHWGAIGSAVDEATLAVNLNRE